MRDLYAKELFSITSLMKLVNEGDSKAAAYFLLYPVWSDAVLDEGLDSESRIYLLFLHFMLFICFKFNLLWKKMLIYTIEMLKDHLR